MQHLHRFLSHSPVSILKIPVELVTLHVGDIEIGLGIHHSDFTIQKSCLESIMF